MVAPVGLGDQFVDLAGGDPRKDAVAFADGKEDRVEHLVDATHHLGIGPLELLRLPALGQLPFGGREGQPLEFLLQPLQGRGHGVDGLFHIFVVATVGLGDQLVDLAGGNLREDAVAFANGKQDRVEHLVDATHHRGIGALELLRLATLGQLPFGGCDGQPLEFLLQAKQDIDDLDQALRHHILFRADLDFDRQVTASDGFRRVRQGPLGLENMDKGRGKLVLAVLRGQDRAQVAIGDLLQRAQSVDLEVLRQGIHRACQFADLVLPDHLQPQAQVALDHFLHHPDPRDQGGGEAAGKEAADGDDQEDARQGSDDGRGPGGTDGFQAAGAQLQPFLGFCVLELAERVQHGDPGGDPRTACHQEPGRSLIVPGPEQILDLVGGMKVGRPVLVEGIQLFLLFLAEIAEAEVLHRLIRGHNIRLQVALGRTAQFRNEDVLVDVPAQREHGALRVRQLGAGNHGLIVYILQIAADCSCAQVSKHGYENDDKRCRAGTSHELGADLEVVEGLHGVPP